MANSGLAPDKAASKAGTPRGSVLRDTEGASSVPAASATALVGNGSNSGLGGSGQAGSEPVSASGGTVMAAMMGWVGSTGDQRGESPAPSRGVSVGVTVGVIACPKGRLSQELHSRGARALRQNKVTTSASKSHTDAEQFRFIDKAVVKGVRRLGRFYPRA